MLFGLQAEKNRLSQYPPKKLEVLRSEPQNLPQNEKRKLGSFRKSLN
jgi:hypothetical protein